MKKTVAFLISMCLVLTSFGAAFAKETFSTGMDLTITKDGKDLFTLTDVSRHYDSEDEVDYIMDYIECYGTPVLTALRDAFEVWVVYGGNGEQVNTDFWDGNEYILPDNFTDDPNNMYSFVDESSEEKVIAMEVEPGDKYTFTKPGVYAVLALYDLNEDDVIDELMFEFTLLEGENPYTQEEVDESNFHVNSVEALPTTSPLSMNKTMTLFEAYNINGNNYFKLRDIAQYFLTQHELLMFNVGWDAQNNAIDITTGAFYEAVGGEMAQGIGETQLAIESTAKVYVNGKEVNMKAYNINGNNFFKLRDLADVIGFYVGWNAEGNYIEVDRMSPEQLEAIYSDNGKTTVYDEDWANTFGIYHIDPACPRIAGENVSEVKLTDTLKNGSIRCQVCGK